MPVSVSHRWTCLGIGFVIALIILFLVRKNRLRIRYTAWWLFIAGTFLILGMFPTLSDWIGGALGVHYPPILFVVAGIGLILIKMLTMDIERGEQERRIRILTEKMAVLKGEKHGDREP